MAHFRAVLLMYHHWLPSPAPFFESQIASLKSGFSLRMEGGMVPLSPTGIRASRPKIEVMGTPYRTFKSFRLHAAFVNNSGVAFIQPSCHYSTAWVSTINTLSSISHINDSPGSKGPVYSSSTDTKAHKCLFSPRSVFDSTWNSSRISQNQTLSIRSSKTPCEIPGGRMKTKSWRLARMAPLNFQLQMAKRKCAARLGAWYAQ